MVCNIGITIFMIVEVAALALFVIGTPLAMFRSRTDDSDGNTACLTMWGYKTKCSDKDYTIKVNEMFDDSKCDTRKDIFRASEVLSIISIAVFTACFIFALLMCCCSCLTCCCRILLMIVIVVGMLSGAATFACMAYMYNNDSEKLLVVIDGGGVVFIDDGDTKKTATSEASDSVATLAALPSGIASGNAHLINGSLPALATENSTDVPDICDVLKSHYKYGAGFILIIVGWGLHTINIIFALLPV